MLLIPHTAEIKAARSQPMLSHEKQSENKAHLITVPRLTHWQQYFNTLYMACLKSM